MDTIGFGSDREPRRWRPGWRPPRPWARRRAWLVAVAAAAGVATAAAVLAATVLATAGGLARRPVSASVPAVPSPPLLRGVPADGVRTDLFLAGENFLRVARPRQVAAGFLVDGLSPLLPPGHGAEADQLAPVPGGVVAQSATSPPPSATARGRGLPAPAANDSPGHATAEALSSPIPQPRRCVDPRQVVAFSRGPLWPSTWPARGSGPAAAVGPGRRPEAGHYQLDTGPAPGRCARSGPPAAARWR